MCAELGEVRRDLSGIKRGRDEQEEISPVDTEGEDCRTTSPKTATAKFLQKNVVVKAYLKEKGTLGHWRLLSGSALGGCSDPRKSGEDNGHACRDTL